MRPAMLAKRPFILQGVLWMLRHLLTPQTALRLFHFVWPVSLVKPNCCGIYELFFDTSVAVIFLPIYSFASIIASQSNLFSFKSSKWIYFFYNPSSAPQYPSSQIEKLLGKYLIKTETIRRRLIEIVGVT